jgi:hypothetical protein
LRCPKGEPPSVIDRELQVVKTIEADQMR